MARRSRLKKEYKERVDELTHKEKMRVLLLYHRRPHLQRKLDDLVLEVLGWDVVPTSIHTNTRAYKTGWGVRLNNVGAMRYLERRGYLPIFRLGLRFMAQMPKNTRKNGTTK